MRRQFISADAPLLRAMAHDVERFESSALDALIADMFDTMRHSRGVGLAAPQIGVSQRVIVFEFQGGDRAPDTAPIASTVLINPVISLNARACGRLGGCLSLPGCVVGFHARLGFIT